MTTITTHPTTTCAYRYCNAGILHRMPIQPLHTIEGQRWHVDCWRLHLAAKELREEVVMVPRERMR